MAGGAIKCHFFETATRAALIREDYPALQLVGGINPEAVRKVGMVGAKMLWFPTMDVRAFQCFKHKEDPSYDGSRLLTACDENGQLRPEVIEVLKIAVEYDMVIGTGHLSPGEGMKIVEKAFALGAGKLVLTHAEHPAIAYTVEEQKRAASMGAYIEHSLNNCWFGRCSEEAFIHDIKALGAEHVILTGDFGQADAPYFDDAMEEYLEKFSYVLTEKELDKMLRENPAALLS